MKPRIGVALVAGLAMLIGIPSAASLSAQTDAAASEPVSLGGPASFRRLDADQYKNAIKQIFGPNISVGGRFEPGLREEGLLAIGSSHATVTPSGFEQHAARARSISAQVLSENNRAAVLTCLPGAAFDRACADRFYSDYGRQLFRRPLNQGERTALLALTQQVSQSRGSFVAGLEAGLYSILASPAFIYRIEATEPDAHNPGQLQLDSFSLATRISFLLWNAPPDKELLDAAESGALRTEEGLNAQVTRLMESPRLELGVRAFFSDMLGLNEFDGLTKDSSIFPIFSPRLRDDAQEQLLRTVVDHLLNQDADYRDLFTTRQTFISRQLAALYGVPMDGRQLGGWAPYAFPEGSPHSGILALPAFLMLDLSHEGRTSPTIRGLKVRENLMCQKVPLPPANVDFQLVQDVTNPNFRTGRERLLAHQDNPVCAGCHRITDPIGLSLENYTAVGQFRLQENGAPIDASGRFEGQTFTNAIELQSLLHDSPSIASCVVQRTFEYGVGRGVASGEESWLEHQIGSFANDGHRYRALLRRIATSPAFRTVSNAPAEPAGNVALSHN